MNKKLIIIIVLVIGLIVLGFFIFKKEVPINEQQMYGAKNYEEYVANRSEQNKANDEIFVNNIKKMIADKAQPTITSLQDAAKYTCSVAFDFYQKGDFTTAMKRYNQAWLLDQSHPCSYEGFELLK